MKRSFTLVPKLQLGTASVPRGSSLESMTAAWTSYLLAAFRSWSFEDIGITRLEPGNESQKIRSSASQRVSTKVKRSCVFGKSMRMRWGWPGDWVS